MAVCEDKITCECVYDIIRSIANVHLTRVCVWLWILYCETEKLC